MSAPQHNGAEDQLAGYVPAARERVGLIGQACADADAAVAGDDLEDDVEHRVRHGVAVEVGHLDAGNEEDREHEPPEVVRKLAAYLLPDELRACAFLRCGRAGE